ncbi:GL12081 [Drosophila persimilis]|uniref:Sorbitol dehydrogenase n=1 Tax=Drosophila persimilis TaxID=7234 RepID=B4GL88_DROPE|nr:GL12081 [Drosophila persimilis]
MTMSNSMRVQMYSQKTSNNVFALNGRVNNLRKRVSFSGTQEGPEGNAKQNVIPIGLITPETKDGKDLKIVIVPLDIAGMNAEDLKSTLESINHLRKYANQIEAFSSSMVDDFNEMMQNANTEVQRELKAATAAAEEAEEQALQEQQQQQQPQSSSGDIQSEEQDQPQGQTPVEQPQAPQPLPKTLPVHDPVPAQPQGRSSSSQLMTQPPAPAPEPEAVAECDLNEVKISVPRTLSDRLNELAISSMELSFEMDMTNVHDAIECKQTGQQVLVPNNPVVSMNTRVELATPGLVEQTVPLRFNALIAGVVNIDVEKLNLESMTEDQVPDFNDDVTSLAANLCSAALENGLCADQNAFHKETYLKEQYAVRLSELQSELSAVEQMDPAATVSAIARSLNPQRELPQISPKARAALNRSQTQKHMKPTMQAMAEPEEEFQGPMLRDGCKHGVIKPKKKCKKTCPLGDPCKEDKCKRPKKGPKKARKKKASLGASEIRASGGKSSCGGKKDAKKDPCAKKDGKGDKKKKDPCAKFKKGGDKKKDPCGKKDDKKKDPCGKKGGKDEKKKKDPCAKFKSGEKKDPCAKKDDKKDPCGKKGGKDDKKKKDPCAKFKSGEKKDPCAKKDDKKKDPCGKKDDKKKDPCAKFKKGGDKKKDPCAKKDDKKKDPCAKKDDKKKDPCGKKDDKKKDPCAKFKKGGDKKKDPCAKKGDKKKDPCAKKDDKKKDPCGKKGGKGDGKKKDPCAKFKKGGDKKKDPCSKKYSTFASPCRIDGLNDPVCRIGDTCQAAVAASHYSGHAAAPARYLIYSTLVRRHYGGKPTKTQLCGLAAGDVLTWQRGYAKKGGKKEDGGKCAALDQKLPLNRGKDKKARNELRTDCYVDGEECPKNWCTGNCAKVRFPRKKCDKNKKKKSGKKHKSGKEGNKLLSLESVPALALALAQRQRWNTRDFTCQAETQLGNDRTGYMIHVPRRYEIEMLEIPLPCPKEYETIIRVGSVALSGSDIHIYENGNEDMKELTLGHEATGFVEEVGSRVQNLQLGDRVVCEATITCGSCDLCKEGRYQMCERLWYKGFLGTHQIHHADLCHRLPDNITMEEGSLIQTLASACAACLKAGILPISNVLIIGSGPTTIAAGLVAKALSAKQVTIATNMEATQHMATREFGLNCVLYGTNGMYSEELEAIYCKARDWPNVVINFAISAQTMNLSIMALKPCGICVLAECASEVASFNTVDLLMKNIKMRPSFRCANMYPIALQLMASRLAPMRKLIGKTYHITKVDAAFQEAQHESNTGIKKIIVNCSKADTGPRTLRRRKV